MSVGQTLKAAPELLEIARAFQLGRRSRTWELLHPQLVRAHWRAQKHGKGLALTKRIHIEPYYKGKTKGFDSTLSQASAS